MTSTEPECALSAEGAALSEWFGPFLDHFVKETYRAGGEVHAVREEGRLAALVLTDPAERVASVFTRDPARAEGLVRSRREPWVFAEAELEPPRESYLVYVGRVRSLSSEHAFRHRVRLAEPSDLPRVIGLLREEYASLNERWFAPAPHASELGFLSEVDGELVGVAWVSIVGTRSRLHSLLVRPGYRRLGIGTDLLFARLLWARLAGVEEVLSEIAESNVASRSIAERAGMRPIGRLFLYPRTPPLGAAGGHRGPSMGD
jgi:RimJ/RimL family protein N-acetyltransferase